MLTDIWRVPRGIETGIAVLHGMEVNVVGFRRGRKRNAEIDILYVLSIMPVARKNCSHSHDSVKLGLCTLWRCKSAPPYYVVGMDR